MDTISFTKDIIRAIVTEILRFRGAVATIFTVVLVAVIFVSLHWPKYYVSNATIVKDVTNVIEPLLRGAAEVSTNKNEKVRDLIYSRRVLEKVIDRLDITGLTPEMVELEIQKVRGGLTINAIRGSGGITNISYQSTSPEEAYKTLSAVVEVFIEDRIEDKQRKSYEAFDFISQQAENYRRRLEVAETKLKEFKSKSIDVNEGTVKAKIASLTSEIESLKISMGETTEKIQSTKQQIESEGANVAVRLKLEALTERRASLSERLDQLRLTYQDSYPDIIALSDQLAEVESSIVNITGDSATGGGLKSDLPLLEELRKQLSTAEVNLKIQKRRLNALETLLAKEIELGGVVTANQATLLNLTRDYDVTKGLYEKMLARKENAKLTLALNDEGQGESYRLVDPASFPLKESGIRALFIFLAAPLVAFALPVGLVIAIVILDPRMRSPTLVKSKLPEGVALLATVPHRSSHLSEKLLRKDIFLLVMLAISLVVGYVYAFNVFKNVL